MRREDTNGAVISGNKVITNPCSLRKKQTLHGEEKCRNNQIEYINKLHLLVNNTVNV